MSKKRILIFSTAYFPFIGGAEIAVREIAKRLSDLEFVMIAAKMDKELPTQERKDNIEIHRLGKGDKWDKIRLALFGAKEAKKLGKFDAVWSIMASYSGFAALAYKKQNKDVKYLLTLQEGDPKEHIYRHVWFVWPLFVQIFRRADRIQAISQYLAVWAREMGAQCSIEIIPNGVDFNKFFTAKADKRLYCNNKHVITVSRLVKKNGVEDLIRSVEFLPEYVHLIILGSGELENNLKNLVKEKKLAKRIHFVGSVPPEQIPLHLKQSEVFCRPSLSEGLGNAFLEAMSAGVPTVGTKVGGIPDFLRDGQTGWFCEVKNSKSIAEKIKYILDEKNKIEVAQVRKQAEQMVKEKYDWDKIAEQMRGMFFV